MRNFAVRLGVLLGVLGMMGLGSRVLRADEGAARAAAAALSPGLMGQVETEAPVAAKEPEKEEESKVLSFFKSINLDGYLETSYTYNARGPNTPAPPVENVGRVFDVESNEFSLNAVELRAVKNVDENNFVGFKVDGLVGQTAKFIQSEGLFKQGGASTSDIDLVQAMMMVYVPGVGATIEAGKFITHAGAEVIYSPENDNFSRSYLFGYAIPFTHTGVMWNQPLLKRGDDEPLLNINGGVANGWDNVKDLNDAKMFHLQGVLTAMDGLSFWANLFWSGSEQAGDNANSRTLMDLVLDFRPLQMMNVEGGEALKFLLNFDWGGEEGANIVTGGYADWFGLAGIVRYDFSDQWYVAGRGEVFQDDGLSRTLGFGAPFVAAGGDDLTVSELTFTLGYLPWEALLLRGEVRADWSDERVFNGPDAQDKYNQLTFAIDAIFKI